MKKRLLMVSNRLPVKIAADGTATRTAGGLASALEGAELENEQVWVGWPGGAEEDFENKDAITKQLNAAEHLARLSFAARAGWFL